jgi:hypothetical protein
MPPINILYTHLSASFYKAKTCKSLQVTDAQKSKRCKDAPSYCKQKID